MRDLTWKCCLLGALMWVAPAGTINSVWAAEERSPGLGDRLERLEMRLNELAERQEQMMRRFNSPQQERPREMTPRPNVPQERQRQVTPRPNIPQDRQQQMMGRLRERQRALAPLFRDRTRLGAPLPGVMPPAAPDARKAVKDLLGLMILVWIICNILLAIWIFIDIRKRGQGSSFFIALALVAGIPSAVIYSLVRIGDKRDAASEAKS